MRRATPMRLLLAIMAWAALCTVASITANASDGDIMTNPGFESPKAIDWAGSSAIVQPQTGAHSGKWCLHVKDAAKDAIGYASSKPVRVSLQGGGRFYAEAWIRIDNQAEERTGYAVASVDIAFYDANGKLLLTQPVGKTTGYKWTRVSNLVTLPYEAALIGFRVTPADEVSQILGAVYIDDVYLAPLPAAEAAGRVKLLEAPKPPKGAAEYQASPRPSDGTNMALTIKKLENGFDPQRPLVIWAIGSSFTDFLGNGEDLIAAIQARFPNAPPIVYKKMVGGSTPYHLLQGWARHLVIPDQPDVVLIYNFGKTAGMERVIRELRTQTTADIVVGTLHWCRNHQPVWPDPDAVNRHLDPNALRELCARYGVEFVESRREITQYMLDNNLEINDLIVDAVHQSPYAAKIINANIARHFHRTAQFSYEPNSRERRILANSETVSKTGNWQAADPTNAVTATGAATMEVQFTGNRIDLIGQRNPDAGALKVFIDGTPATDLNAYYATYIQADPGNYIDLNSAVTDYRRIISDRCPHGVSLGENIVPQTWTITMTSDNGDYSLVGSITGPDGQGNAFKPFTSASGQIIIEPRLWRLAKTNRTGDAFTFEVKRNTLGKVAFTGEPGKFRTTLADGLTNGPHTLTIESLGDGPVTVEAFDIFEPPLRVSEDTQSP